MRVFFIASESLKFHMGSHKGWNARWQIQNVTQNLVQSKQKLAGSVNNILAHLLVHTSSKHQHSLQDKQTVPITQMISRKP
jgi:hypothetical protein